MIKLRKPHALSILFGSLLLLAAPMFLLESVEATSATNGYITFFDSNGGRAVDPINFDTDSTGKIKIGQLSNNNLFLVYTGGTETTRGKFAILNANGEQIKPPAFFTEKNVKEAAVLELPNRNVMIVSVSGPSDQGNFDFYNLDGAVLEGSKSFTDGSISDISAILMNNGNVLIVYNDKTANQGKYIICGEDGNVVHAPVKFSDTPVAAIDAIMLNNKDVFVAYVDTGNANAGKTLTISDAGNVGREIQGFSTGAVGSLDLALANNKTVLLVYSDAADGNKGKLQIFSEIGDSSGDPKIINSGATGKVSISELYNLNMMLSYTDLSDSNKGKFVISDQAGAIMNGAINFADLPVGNIFTIRSSNRNILIAYNELTAPACTDVNWQSRIEPATCPASGKQTKFWDKIGDCSGGVTHPASEELTCVYEQPTATCTEADWTSRLEPASCPASGRQNKIWSKTGNCSAGQSHPANEQIECAGQKEFKIKNIKLFGQLKGRIILKVADSGKAYYIDPASMTMYFLGRPSDAFSVMRAQGLGIKNADLAKIPTGSEAAKTANQALINRLKGKILLAVEAKGEAWYVNPVDGKRYFLGRPSDAFAVMRKLGLGISNANFDNLQK